MAKLYFYRSKTSDKTAKTKAKLENGEIVPYTICTDRPMPPKTLEKYYEFLGRGEIYANVYGNVV